MADFKYILMQTALEKLLEYVADTYQDEQLDIYIEEINGICGTIERIHNRINKIEEERSIFDTLNPDLQLELIRLKNKLTETITIL